MRSATAPSAGAGSPASSAGRGSAQAAIAALWAPPATARSTWSPVGDGVDYLMVPSPSRPRLLVPVDVPGADRLLLRHGGGRRTRLGRQVWRTVQRARLARYLPMPRLRVRAEPDGIEAYLGQALGQVVRVGVLLGPPRANLKPVLALYGRGADGRPHVVAFAKVGTSQVSAPLLAREASALQQVSQASMPGVLAPALLHHGSWRGLPVLVQEALPLAQTGSRPPSLDARVVAAIASSTGGERAALHGSSFWRQVQDAGTSPWHGQDVAAFGRLAAAVPVHAECLFGAWHGDLGPWNAAQGSDHVEVWDWERFEAGVPAGMDAAHWAVQVALPAGHTPEQAWPKVREQVAQSLTALGCEPGEAPLVVAAYLLAIWSRYRADATDSATPALRQRVQWLGRLADIVTPTLQEPTA